MSIVNLPKVSGLKDMICLLMSMTNFGIWLQGELDKRSWNQAELSRRSGLSTAGISRIMTGNRGLGLDAVQLISRAMGIPVETIVRVALNLPPKPRDQAELDELIHKYGLLSPEQKDDVRSLIDFLLWRGAPVGVIEGYAEPLPTQEPEPVKPEFDEEKFEKALRMIAPAYRKRVRREDYPQLLKLYQKADEPGSDPAGR